MEQPEALPLPILLSLEAVFPASGLSAAFHSGPEFRTALRLAARADLFDSSTVGSDSKRQRALHAPSSTVVLDWRRGALGCPRMDAVLESAGVALSGCALLSRLSALCRAEGSSDSPAGSLTDIVSNGRAGSAHSWHADSGLRSNTVLLAFAAAPVVGAFSHIVPLSHALAPTRQRGAVIEWEAACAAAALPPAIPPECVLRPLFGVGAEVVVYRDDAVLHSAPDAVAREALWRLI